MTTAVPIRDLKNTAEFARTVMNSAEPVIVTRNGYDEFVVMKSEDYRQMQQELAEAKLLRILLEGKQDLERGDYVDGPDFVERISRKYGL